LIESSLTLARVRVSCGFTLALVLHLSILQFNLHHKLCCSS